MAKRKSEIHHQHNLAFMTMFAEPDGEILKETTVNLLEHESDPPSPSDLIRFWIYLMYKMLKTGYHRFLAIASKYPPLKSALKYKISPHCYFRTTLY